MLQVVFDDTSDVPDEIRAAFGIDRFGSLVFRRRSWLETMHALVREAGWPPMVHLRDQADVAALVQRVRRADDEALYLICPSHLFAACGHDSLQTFLRQIEYSPTALYMALQDERGRRGWALMRAALFRQFLVKQQEGDLEGFFEQHGDRFVSVPDRLRLIDLGDDPVLHEFLSGQFDARHFNALEREQYTVVKRSNDRDKLKREFDFYSLIPPAMQSYFIQPFDFRDDGASASYRMERVGIPDMALQWVHGAFLEHQFKKFLAHIFHFISIRPERSIGKSGATAVRDELYLNKVRARVAMLKDLPAYVQLVPLFDSAFGGIDALVYRYMGAFDRMQRRSFQETLVIGHGDLCFSNIFYSKTNQYLKMIDPRGASKEDDLLPDVYYDLAKLSHSVQGAYDFVNHGKFDITIADDLRPRLSIKGASSGWAAAIFNRQLEEAGFDPDLTRLYEASLFISMLPLHIDRPIKVLAFAINASEILDRLPRK